MMASTTHSQSVLADEAAAIWMRRLVEEVVKLSVAPEPEAAMMVVVGVESVPALLATELMLTLWYGVKAAAARRPAHRTKTVRDVDAATAMVAIVVAPVDDVLRLYTVFVSWFVWVLIEPDWPKS
jgi:hypothetical protein